MKYISEGYMVVCTILVSLVLFVTGCLGIITLFITDFDGVSDYKIVQYAEYNKIETRIWGKKYDDETLLCYSSSVEFTASSFDSISFAEKSRAEKLIKSFEKLNSND